MSSTSKPTVSRRQVLAGAGAAGAALVSPHLAWATPRPWLSSDSAPLRRVLVHAASGADYHDSGVTGGDDLCWQQTVADIVAQQAELVARLRLAGAQVLQLESVLAGAIEVAKRRGTWTGWLRDTFPELDAASEVRAATLLARDPNGRCAVAASGQGAMHGLGYVRDFAVMLPSGLVLGNVADRARARQQAVFRFMVAHAAEFRGYPILLDGEAAGLRVEGGDMQVLDERTLLVGVGNHTEARIAPLLARRTGMHVIAVNIRNADQAQWPLAHDPLRDFFLHLDTGVAQLAPGHLLVLPWLFEAEHTGRVALHQPGPLLAEFGTITEFRAHTGARIAATAGAKLVDHLRARGTRFSFVGSDSDKDLPAYVAAATRTGVIVPRRERQAANLLATAPGRLLAFSGAPATHAALTTAGAHVHVIAGGEWWRGYGGPHCQTLPLERG